MSGHDFRQTLGGDFECRKCSGWTTYHLDVTAALRAHPEQCPGKEEHGDCPDNREYR